MIIMEEAMISNIGDMAEYTEDELAEEIDEGDSYRGVEVIYSEDTDTCEDTSDELTYSEDTDACEDASNEVTCDAPQADEGKDEFDPMAELTALKKGFPELSGIDSLSALKDPEKYERFRRMGLTPSEAYMASGDHRLATRGIPSSPLSVTRRAEGIPDRQLRMAREIFTGLTDVEIQALYKRVTK